MTNFDENWDRWCKISFLKHFEDGKGDTSVYAEGFTRDTDHTMDYLELRVDGPDTQELSKGKWRLYFEVNVLCVAKMTEDAYRINRLTGRVSKLFTDCIHVRKHGIDAVDDETVIGCLRLVPLLRERVRTTHFGRIRPDTEIIQASVEGHYEIFFD